MTDGRGPNSAQKKCGGKRESFSLFSIETKRAKGASSIHENKTYGVAKNATKASIWVLGRGGIDGEERQKLEPQRIQWSSLRFIQS